MRPTQTTPPDTPNPFTWRGFANVRMGDYILGEDTVEPCHSLGFCGDTVTVFCPTCNEVLGAIPAELYTAKSSATSPTTTSTPFLDWHDAKHHPRLA